MQCLAFQLMLRAVRRCEVASRTIALAAVGCGLVVFAAPSLSALHRGCFLDASRQGLFVGGRRASPRCHPMTSVDAALRSTLDHHASLSILQTQHSAARSALQGSPSLVLRALSRADNFVLEQHRSPSVQSAKSARLSFLAGDQRNVCHRPNKLRRQRIECSPASGR